MSSQHSVRCRQGSPFNCQGLRPPPVVDQGLVRASLLAGSSTVDSRLARWVSLRMPMCVCVCECAHVREWSCMQTAYASLFAFVLKIALIV